MIRVSAHRARPSASHVAINPRDQRPITLPPRRLATCSICLSCGGESPTNRWRSIRSSHFITGEPIAKVSQANGGLLQRDMRLAQRARDVLRDLSPDELIERVKKAGDLYLNATLPMGDGQQTPEDFARAADRPRPACPSTCARSTCRRTTSCSRTWTACSTR